MKKIVLSVFVLCFFVAVASLSAQEKYTLKNQYPEGRYQMVVESDMDMVMEMSGQKMPTKQLMTQYQTLIAEKKQADGTQKVSMETTRILMNQKMMGMDMKFDSDDKDADKSPLKAVSVMVGLKITMIFDKDGKITKVDGIDEFTEKLSNDPNYPKQVLELMKKQVNNETMTKMFNAQREAMPTKPVAVGDTWQSAGSADIPMVGKADTKLDNSLEEVKEVDGKKIAVIRSEAKIESEEKQEMDMGIAKMDLTKMKTNTISTMEMELETGLVARTVADLEMEMDAQMNAGDQKMEMKMTGKGKTTTTVTRAAK